MFSSLKYYLKEVENFQELAPGCRIYRASVCRLFRSPKISDLLNNVALSVIQVRPRVHFGGISVRKTSPVSVRSLD